MNLAQRVLLIVSVLAGCVGCDQLTKSMARQTLAEVNSVSLLNDVLRLQYVENPGAFLSLGANTPAPFKYWVFIVFVGLVLVGMLVFLVISRKSTSAQTIALSLLLAGGFGNLIDRIGNDGRVIDFMNMGIGSLRTGVFNVADIAITAGALWLMIDVLKGPRREEP